MSDRVTYYFPLDFLAGFNFLGTSNFELNSEYVLKIESTNRLELDVTLAKTLICSRHEKLFDLSG